MIRTNFTWIAFVVIARMAIAQEAAKQPASMPDVLAALREGGAAPEPVHFETQTNGMAIGYASASLTPATDGAAKGWEHRVEMIMTLPNGPRFVNEVKARLSRQFEPQSIELHREIIDPAKPKEVMTDRAVITEKEIEISHKAGDAAAEVTKVPKPDGPFAFAMEFLIPRVNFEKFPRFSIREFNSLNGSLIEHTFTATKRPDGTYLVTSVTPDGKPAYSFDFDASGRLKSWNQQPMPLIFQRCSAERAAEIKKSLVNP